MESEKDIPPKMFEQWETIIKTLANISKAENVILYQIHKKEMQVLAHCGNSAKNVYLEDDVFAHTIYKTKKKLVFSRSKKREKQKKMKSYHIEGIQYLSPRMKYMVYFVYMIVQQKIMIPPLMNSSLFSKKQLKRGLLYLHKKNLQRLLMRISGQRLTDLMKLLYGTSMIDHSNLLIKLLKNLQV